MSLRAGPVEQSARLPDGRAVVVRIGLFDGGYVARNEIDTVTLDLVIDDEVSEALELAREVAAGLEAGELNPTASSIEHLALTIPD